MSRAFIMILFVGGLFTLGCETKVNVTSMESESARPEDQTLRNGGTYVRRGGLEAKINIEDIAHREQLPNGAEISVMISTNGSTVR